MQQAADLRWNKEAMEVIFVNTEKDVKSFKNPIPPLRKPHNKNKRKTLKPTGSQSLK